jgi:tripartite-type tricarboxylate transporter receptor subunit TctC
MRTPTFTIGLLDTVSTHRLLALALILTSAWVPVLSHAQTTPEYPGKPIRLLIGFAAGGNTDVSARVVAKRVSELLGQPILIDNKSGAGGSLAGETVATAPADGYTLLVGTLSTQVLNIGLLAKPRFNAETDFVPLALTNQSAVYFGVPAVLRTPTLKDFVAKAKQQTGNFNYGAPSVGGVGHLSAVIFNKQAGVTAQPVAYKGSSAAVIDLAGGRIEYLIDGMAVLAPQLASGKVVVLALSGKQRNPAWPDIPTFAEAGYADMSNLLTWNGWFAPAKTPASIVAKLNQALRTAMADANVIQALQNTGNEVSPAMSSAQTAKFIAAERRRWLPLIKDAGIQPE